MKKILLYALVYIFSGSVFCAAEGENGLPTVRNEARTPRTQGKSPAFDLQKDQKTRPVRQRAPRSPSTGVGNHVRQGANPSYGASDEAGTLAATIHVIALESSSSLSFKAVPFKARVNIWPALSSRLVESAAVSGGTLGASITKCQEDMAEEAVDAANHGIMVSSLLVADAPIGRLPADVSIHLTDGWEGFVAKAHAQGIRATDLLLVNYSGIAGAIDVGSLEEEISAIANHYSKGLRTKTVVDLIEETEKNADTIRNFRGDSNDLFKCFNAILDILKSASPTDAKIRAAVAGFTADMRVKSEATSQKHMQQLIDALTAFPNILIMWALGNEGECVDTDTDIAHYLSVTEILSHTVLVEGSGYSKRHRDSNFTEIFARHVVSRPFTQRVWSPGRMRVAQESGTSFAAPVATVDAYRIAQAMIDNGDTPSCLGIKEALLHDYTNQEVGTLPQN